MVGVSRCSIIVEKIWSFFVLLIWVVLRSFIGIDELVQILLRNILNGLIIDGMIIVYMVLIRCILINSKYNGMVSNVIGMSRLIMMMMSSIWCFGNWNFDIIYLQEIEISVLMILDIVEYSNELSIYFGNIFLVQVMRECQLVVQLNLLKVNLEVFIRLVLFLVDVMISQMIGSKKQ